MVLAMEQDIKDAFDRQYSQGDETRKLLDGHIRVSIERKGKQDNAIAEVKRDVGDVKGRLGRHLSNITWFWRSVFGFALAILVALFSGSCS